jgi:O-methyltransferase
MPDLRNVIKNQIRRFGYELRRTAANDVFFVKDIPHSIVTPQATYSPWLADKDFIGAYRAITEPHESSHTLVDRYRCYELWQLASRNVTGDVLEIGVWRGGTGCLIAKRLQTIAPQKTVYLCDTFTGVVGVTSNDPSYSDGEHSDTSEQIVKDLAECMGLTNVRTLSGVFPSDTGKEISNRRFSLVHIDVDVYKSAKDCFEWALPRLSVGGAVVFDDYGFERCGGVTKMVNELIPTPGSEIAIIHNLNGHAVVIKVQGTS